MYNNEIWTKHTRLILTGVIIVAIAGWVAGILQTASIAIDTANDLLKAAGEEELPLKPFTLSAQTLTIIGYILYLVGLNGFKSIQRITRHQHGGTHLHCLRFRNRSHPIALPSLFPTCHFRLVISVRRFRMHDNLANPPQIGF